jgi:hypothetical protein
MLCPEELKKLRKGVLMSEALPIAALGRFRAPFSIKQPIQANLVQDRSIMLSQTRQGRRGCQGILASISEPCFEQ